MSQFTNTVDTSGCRPFLLVLGGIFLLGVSLIYGVNEIRLRSSGRVATARVTYAWTSATKQGQTNRSYYEFTADGRRYTGSSGDHYPGETLRVEYLPSNPDDNRIVGASPWWPSGAILIIVSLGMLLFGALDFRRSSDLAYD